MNRQDVLERLQEYVDGEIADPDERDRFRRLIETDPEVEAAYRHAKKYTTTILEALAPLRKDERFETRLMDRIRREDLEGAGSGDEAAPEARPIRLWPYVLVAGTMAVLTVAILATRGRQEGVGILQTHRGRVILRSGGKTGNPERVVAPGQVLRHGDRLLVGADGLATVKLGRSRIEIFASTEVHFYRDRQRRTLYFRRGGARLKAASNTAHTLQAGRIVVTREAEPGPAEWTFTLEPAARATVRVRRGHVTVSNVTATITLRAGQEVTLAETGGPVEPVPKTPGP